MKQKIYAKDDVNREGAFVEIDVPVGRLSSETEYRGQQVALLLDTGIISQADADKLSMLAAEDAERDYNTPKLILNPGTKLYDIVVAGVVVYECLDPVGKRERIKREAGG